MSTELKTLSAKIEIPNKEQMSSNYLDTEVYLTRFYGGANRGSSLQLGFRDENGNYHHVQLDNATVKQLLKELIEVI